MYHHKNVKSYWLNSISETLDIDGVCGCDNLVFGESWLVVPPNIYDLPTGTADCTCLSETTGSILHSDCYQIQAPPNDFTPYDWA